MLIQPYQASWAKDFAQIEIVLLETLAPLVVMVHHVGSTAVPDLPAKSIIDIDLAYPAETAFSDIKKGLESIGYYHNGNQGIEDREVFKRQSSTTQHPILDVVTHHLYVCPVHSEELKRHLLFRDYLRENTEACEQYAQLKQMIATEANQDKKLYAQLKEIQAKEFIATILQKAR
jgi:GrpB-like predicted nucleotidyltransferase (UPF0157 family)